MAIDVFNPVGGLVNSIDRTQRVSDLISNYHFHVMDISFSTPVVFNLAFGFRFCSAPEMSVDTKEIKQGNFEYPKSFVMGAKTNDISFHRGVRLGDSDFYDWCSSAIRGSGTQKQLAYRKKLLIIQYSDMSTNLGSSGMSLGAFHLSFQSVTDLVSYIPMRAWILNQCIPVNYKSSNEFDSLAPDLSIQELTIKCQYWTEISTGV